jgi:outer membrane protein assembly factor BamB
MQFRLRTVSVLLVLLSISVASGLTVQQSVGSHSGFALGTCRSGTACLIALAANSLVRIDAATGAVLGRHSLPDGHFVWEDGPILEGSTAVLLDSTGSALCGIEYETGERRWLIGAGNEKWTTIGRRSTFMVGHGGVVYLNAQASEGVVAVEADTGRILWTHRRVPPEWHFVTEIAVAARAVVTNYGALDRTTGEQLASFGGTATSLDSEGDLIVAGYIDGTVRRLSPSTGTAMWAARPWPDQEIERVLLSEQRAVVFAKSLISDGADVTVMDARSGRVCWQRKVASHKYHSVAAVVDARSVYIQSTPAAGRNEITCCDLRDGRVRWTRRIPDSVSGYIVNRELLFVYSTGTSGCALTAMRTDTGATVWRTPLAAR